MQERVIIMEAAGRNFHNFNVCFRDNPRYRMVAFTTACEYRTEHMPHHAANDTRRYSK